MIHLKFLFRHILAAPKLVLVLILGIIFSLITLVSLGAFKESVERSLVRDAKKINGGDIILSARSPFPRPLIDKVNALNKKGTARAAATYSLMTMARSKTTDDAVLSMLKIVSHSYPLYGKVTLKSGNDFKKTLSAGKIIVGNTLLVRLNSRMGDTVYIAGKPFTIADVVLEEPDGNMQFFSAGPRVFMAAVDLPQVARLVQKGSRVRYRYLLKIKNHSQVKPLVRSFKKLRRQYPFSVHTFQTRPTQIKRIFDNLLFFLNLIGIFILVLSGVGIYSTLTAFFRKHTPAIAIVKSLGGTSRFIYLQFFTMVLIIGFVGSVAGVILGLALQTLLPFVFQGLFSGLQVTFSPKSIIEGVTLGTVIVTLYAFIPLYRLKNIKPLMVFRKESASFLQAREVVLIGLAILVLFIAVLSWHVDDWITVANFTGGILGLVLVSALFTAIAVFIAGKINPRHLLFRQALRGLFRPGNATRAIIITLSVSLSVIFTILIIERNLNRSFIQSYPEDSPNLFFIDIQPHQWTDFQKTLGRPARYFPAITARVKQIGDYRINTAKERQARRMNYARSFWLTYQDELDDNERIVRGKGLFDPSVKGPQVSVLDSAPLADKIKIGTPIQFTIQGIPLTARVSSIRRQIKRVMRPYFFFILPRSFLEKAPQTRFTAIKADPEELAVIQRKVARRFPNITFVDMTETAKMIYPVVRKITGILRFFTGFSIAAGILMIISSVFATRFARVQEAVYYKVLGARGSFVVKIFALEQLFVGFISAVIALVMSQTFSWVVSKFVLNIPYDPLPGHSLLLIALTCLLVLTVGMLTTLPILHQKPVVFLRENTDE